MLSRSRSRAASPNNSKNSTKKQIVVVKGMIQNGGVPRVETCGKENGNKMFLSFHLISRLVQFIPVNQPMHSLIRRSNSFITVTKKPFKYLQLKNMTTQGACCKVSNSLFTLSLRDLTFLSFQIPPIYDAYNPTGYSDNIAGLETYSSGDKSSKKALVYVYDM
jgi:hypothetical protein